jgi:glycosyltransferase involved in cell wall biosynthesis
VRVLLDVSAVPAQPVGAGVYTVELARGLGRLDDVELVLLTRRGDAARWGEWAPGATIVAEVPDARPARLAWEQTRAPSVADRHDVAVWHGPHYSMPVRLGVPAVVTIHDLTFFDHPEWHERAKVLFFRRMIRAAAARAAALVCVSEFTAQRLRAVCAPAGSTTVIPHGVDHDRFHPAADAAADAVGDRALLAAHGIREPFIGFVSTLEPRKNVPGLVRAFAAIAAEHPEVQLVLGGGAGWGLEAVRQAIEASGVATRIARPGRLSDAAVAALYRRAAVVAYPSFAEGFGLPALEALACGAPLVTSTGSALGEVVGDAAITAAPGDDAALADALRAALAPSTATRLRAAGPARAHAFRWETSVAAHVACYKSVVRVGGESR